MTEGKQNPIESRNHAHSGGPMRLQLVKNLNGGEWRKNKLFFDSILFILFKGTIRERKFMSHHSISLRVEVPWGPPEWA